MIDTKIAKEMIATSLDDIKKKQVITRAESKVVSTFMNYKHAIAVSGIRRSGKTYLIFQLVKKLLNENKLVMYINFEDPRFDERVDQLDILYKSFLEEYGKKEKLYFFLDEIQNISKWEKWVSSMYEKDIKFFVSGSNASLLMGEFSKSLTGRHKRIELYPLNFQQIVSYIDPELCNPKNWHNVERKSEIKRILSRYMQYGGFPEVVFNKQNDIILDYFDDIVSKDIIARHNISFKQSLKELAVLLLTNISSLHSLNSLNKTIQARSINTIKNYLMYLIDAYLIFKVPLFSYSLNKQNVNPFKVYAIDPGIRNAVSFRFSQDMGKLYENAVALELIQKGQGKNIYYWKSSKQEEVDFVVRKGLNITQLIQVCYDISDPKTRKRELKALCEASKDLKCKNLLVITEDQESEELFEDTKINLIPLWKWLLQKR
tara:strand:+ start:2896 stop:4188 length:1293 start_codon:yes stop_codon:yes gene_type:complete